MPIPAYINHSGNVCGPTDRVNAIPVHLPREEPVRTVPDLHRSCKQAKSNKQLLKALVEMGSAHGWWSDCPEEVWTKVHVAAGIIDKPKKEDAELTQYRALLNEGPQNSVIPD